MVIILKYKVNQCQKEYYKMDCDNYSNGSRFHQNLTLPHAQRLSQCFFCAFLMPILHAINKGCSLSKKMVHALLMQTQIYRNQIWIL